jgi:protease-4
VFRAGTFKSYTDQFSRTDMAPSEREETSVWLETLWNAYSQDVTRARSLPAGALKDFVTDQPAALQAVGGDMAKMALQRGLVTALKSKRQVADDLKGLVGEDQDSHSFNSIGMKDYLAAARSKRILKSKSDAKIGIIVASGEIFDGHQPPGATCCAKYATTMPSRPWCCALIARAAANSLPKKSCAKCSLCAKPASRWSYP